LVRSGDGLMREWVARAELTMAPHARRALSCPVNHDLKAFSTPNDNWCCSECDRDVLVGTVMLRCEACDYDICLTCAQGAWQVLMCPEYHKLSSLVVHTPTWYCSLCEGDVLPGDAVMRCAQCDFDLCPRCASAARQPVDTRALLRGGL